MMAATFEEARAHVQIVLGIDLESHLDILHPDQFTAYALIAPLVVAWRYAEAVGRHIVIFDMTTAGHKSHKSGMDLDFDYAPDPHNPVNQAKVACDMLRIGRALGNQVHAFRLGFYFARFDNQAVFDTVRTFDEFQDTFGRSAAEFRKKRGRQLTSMHLGVRYKFVSADYQGDRKTNRGFWGLDEGDTGNPTFSQTWNKRIRDWTDGFIGERASLVAAAALRDLEELDKNPPTLVVLGARGTGPLP